METEQPPFYKDSRESKLGFHEFNTWRALQGLDPIPGSLLEPPQDLPREHSPSPLPRGEGPGVGTNLEGILPITNSLHANSQKLTGQTKRFKWDDFPTSGYAGWRFQGQGEDYPTCGTYHVVGCLEHRPAYGKKVKYSCFRAECPKDHKDWLAKTTRKATERLEAGKPRPSSKAIHVTLSPPRELWGRFLDKDNYRKLRRKAINLLKKAGIWGGMLVFHPCRGNKKTGWYYSPHFHTVCYGWVTSYQEIKGILRGWVLKNLRIRESIGATVYYMLSHAGVHKGLNVVSWYGSLAWNKLQKIPDPPAEHETCPICGGPLTRIIYWGTGPNPFEGEGIEKLDNLETVNWSYEH